MHLRSHCSVVSLTQSVRVRGLTVSQVVWTKWQFTSFIQFTNQTGLAYFFKFLNEQNIQMQIMNISSSFKNFS